MIVSVKKYGKNIWNHSELQLEEQPNGKIFIKKRGVEGTRLYSNVVIYATSSGCDMDIVHMATERWQH